MNVKRICMTLTVAALAGALVVPTSGAWAQGGFPGQGQGRGRRGMRGQGQFGQQGQFGGRQRGFMGNRGQADRNPLTSHVMELIQRPDVQTEIRLDLKQKAALMQVQTQAQQQYQQQMQQMFQTMRQNRGQAAQGTQQDRAAQRQQMRDQMQQQRATFQTQLNEKLNDVLRPDQQARLHQLDLQWRGPLSIADQKVAEEAQVTNEHRAAITTLLNDYQQKQREARQQLFQGMRGGRRGFGANGQPGANNQPNQPQGQQVQPQQRTPQQMQQDFLALQRQDEAARKEAEDKALALLTPDERAHWDAAIGPKFAFRQDITNNQGAF